MAKIDNAYNGALVLSYIGGDQTINREKTIYNKKSPGDRVHTIMDGDRLDMLAYRYYRDSKKWWIIADANDVGDTLINPFILVTGSTLIIPNLEQFETDI